MGRGRRFPLPDRPPLEVVDVVDLVEDGVEDSGEPRGSSKIVFREDLGVIMRKRGSG